MFMPLFLDFLKKIFKKVFIFLPKCNILNMNISSQTPLALHLAPRLPLALLAAARLQRVTLASKEVIYERKRFKTGFKQL